MASETARQAQAGQASNRVARITGYRGVALQLNRHYARLVPRQYATACNGARSVAYWLFPVTSYPHRDGVSRLLGVPWHTARHWLRGTRPLPRWARDRLAEALRGRIEQGAAILAALEAMPVYEPKPRKPPQKKRSEAPMK